MTTAWGTIAFVVTAAVWFVVNLAAWLTLKDKR